MEMRCYCSYPSKPASTRSRVVLDPLRVQFTVIQFHYTIYSAPTIRSYTGGAIFFVNNICTDSSRVIAHYIDTSVLD